MHGPMDRIDLEGLIGPSPDSAGNVRSRKETVREWTPLLLRRMTAGFLGLVSPSEWWSSEGANGPSTKTKPRFVHYWIISAIVCVCLNVLFGFFWREPYVRERQYLVTLQNVVAEVDELRSKSASKKDWEEWTKLTHEKLAPMVADLQKSASVSTLPRQQLLWCARDLATQISGPETSEQQNQEDLMKHYLIRAEQELIGVAR